MSEQGRRRPVTPAAKLKREPWHPAEWEPADASAVQALQRGDASPEQQRRALDWVITKAAMTYDSAFVPGQPDVKDYIMGRQSVGQALRKLLIINIGQLLKQGGSEQP